MIKPRPEKATMHLGTLQKYVPEPSIALLANALQGYSVLIKIKSARKTKFGDYRPMMEGKWAHQITVNHDLNPFAFLVTLLHEIAHMYTFEKHRNKVKPHGDEWKKFYNTIMAPFLENKIFPDDLHAALVVHLGDVKASSCTDHRLFAVLKRYDPAMESGLIMLEELPMGSHFKWRNGNVYQKVEKLRKRYKCVEARSKRTWFFHPMAEVERLGF